MTFLNKEKEYSDVWKLFLNAPTICTVADRIRINAAMAAVKLNEFEYLKSFFEEEHYDIREGENPLTDIWFEFHARKLAIERGLDESKTEILDSLMDEVADKFPPPYEIDFRMSLDKKIAYRVLFTKNAHKTVGIFIKI